MQSWSSLENNLIIEDYFDMLLLEQQKIPFTKSSHRRSLQLKLQNRSERAIESKHANISAILLEEGYPFIKGYLPLSRYQKGLKKLVLEKIQKIDLKTIFPIILPPWTMYSNTSLSIQIANPKELLTGINIPREILFFFRIASNKSHQERILHFENNEYLNQIKKGKNGSFYFFFEKSFKQKVESLKPHCEHLLTPNIPPQLLIQKESSTEYTANLITFEKTTPLSRSNYPPQSNLREEGESSTILTSKYERNTRLRKEAIKIHGTKCKICGMDFGKKYGEWGKGFIEIHHITPLALIGKKHTVDPKRDLIPVCPNCHRMLHRHGQTLLPDQLKFLLRSN